MTTDKRHYISSQINTAESFLKATKNHWLIENKLHWSLDVIFKEDQSRKRKKMQEKQKINKKINIKRMRKMAAWNLNYLLELLNF